jgi:ribonuclease J
MTDTLRIIPLGGCGEIGKNMTLIEYEDEILVIDAGIMFPENDMLGVDFIIPDYDYLLENRDKVKAILITHGHEDHIGALGMLMEKIDAPIYATPLTMGLIDVKLRRADIPRKVILREIQAGDSFAVGSFLVEPFHVAHSIPDCVGFGITTPIGIVVHSGDYKFDHTPFDGWAPDFAKLAEFSARGVLCLLADSTNAERPGWTPSEISIVEPFEQLFHEAKGRIIIATFASIISRIQLVINLAHEYGRKLAVTGRSMRDNTKMARRLGYLEVPDDLLIDIGEVGRYAPDKVVIMATGSQGEPTAVLGRLAMGRHRNLKIQDGDTVVLSAHPIPGNEEMIHRIINRLFQKGANVIYDRIAQVHVSGHASRDEMKLLINLVRPRFLIPVHGELRHLHQHARMGRELGIPDKNIAVVENGTVIEMTEESLSVGPRLPGGYVFVAGSSVGDIGWSVISDREKLAENGFFLAVAPIGRNGALIGKPKYISRGFANLNEAPELLEGATAAIRRVADQYSDSPDLIPKRLEEALGRYLFAETGRRPMVFVVVE